jgi:hypothetical protein
MNPCPNCGADWQQNEILGAAKHGGGYRLLCRQCGWEWDDRDTSYGAREAARREERVPITKPLVECYVNDPLTGERTLVEFPPAEKGRISCDVESLGGAVRLHFEVTVSLR